MIWSIIQYGTYHSNDQTYGAFWEQVYVGAGF